MEELEAVVIETTAKCKTLIEITDPQKIESFRAGDLIDIRDNEDISYVCSLSAFKLRDDLCEHSIPLMVFIVPCSTRSQWSVLEEVV